MLSFDVGEEVISTVSIQRSSWDIGGSCSIPAGTKGLIIGESQNQAFLRGYVVAFDDWSGRHVVEVDADDIHPSHGRLAGYYAGRPSRFGFPDLFSIPVVREFITLIIGFGVFGLLSSVVGVLCGYFWAPMVGIPRNDPSFTEWYVYAGMCVVGFTGGLILLLSSWRRWASLRLSTGLVLVLASLVAFTWVVPEGAQNAAAVRAAMLHKQRATYRRENDAWPNRSAFTVSLAVFRKWRPAVHFARRARSHGIRAYALRSSDYSSLKGGYWLVFSGTYRHRSQAVAARREHQQGFGQARVRYVSTQGASR